MLKTLFLATALMAAAPVNAQEITVNFTKDSVYKHESIISPSAVHEQENGLYTITLEEDKLLGYCIYDKTETPYIDGLKFDDEFVSNYVVTDVDLNIEHTILVKTVYTDDVAGMLMAAKDGNWSRILSNPLIMLELIYFTFAIISVIIGIFMTVKSKGKHAKTVNEFGSELNEIFNTKVGLLASNAEDAIMKYIDSLVMPVYNEMQAQNKDLLSALILSQSGDEKAKLALIDLLKNSANKDVNLISEQIKKGIKDANLAAALLRAKAENTIKEIASGVKDDNKVVDDGTSI